MFVKLPPKDRLLLIKQKIERLRILDSREECRNSFRSFVEQAWPVVDSSPFMSNFCIDGICDHLEAVMMGHIPRLLINVPPRTAKPVWEEEFVVERRRGRIPLKEIAVGDYVLTAAGNFGLVSGVHLQGILPLYKLTEDCGRTLRTAGDHPILTTRGWVEMSKVSGKDYVGLVTPQDRVIQPTKVVSVEEDGVGACRCLTVEGGSPTFTANDIAVHNTTLCGIMFPAWIWMRSHDVGPLSGPQVKFLCASYSDKLTLLSSTAFRRLLQSDWYRTLVPDLELTSDQNSKSHMDNTKGGSRQSTSVGGSLLGLGGNVLIGDDLNNTETEKIVETGADREKTKTFWDEFRSTRRNDPREGRFAIINVQQRVHQEDCSGYWLDSGEKICHFMVPMRHDPLRHCVTVKLPQYDDGVPWEDPRNPDGEELMWPERFGEFEVAGLEKALGPIAAAGRLQQSPKAKGGNIILREYWQLWDARAAQLYGLEWNADIREFPPTELVVASLDTAQKEKEENDYNSLTVWGIWLDRGRNRRAMLMYAWKARLPLNGREVVMLPDEAPALFERRKKAAWGLVQNVADICKRYKVKRLLIEDKTRGHDVANEIRRQFSRESWGVQLINPVQDKVSRAHVTVPLFADGSIWAPDTRWADSVITACESFPKAAFDDEVDSTTQFINWARSNEILVMANEQAASDMEASTHHGKQASVADSYGV